MSLLDDELLLSIALNPGDDSLRRVFADRLLERGSAWGELIHLQLLLKKDRGQRLREAELLGLAEAYLPGVMRHAIVRGSSRWERGFMIGCSIAERELEPALFHPLWSLVHELHAAPVELLPSCPNLKAWTGADPRGQLPRLQGLAVLGLTAERADASWLSSLGIDELHLESTAPPWKPCACCPNENWPPVRLWRDLEWLSDVSLDLTALRVQDGAVELDRWLDSVLGARLGFSRLALRSAGGGGWELELSQSAPGRFDRAALKRWASARPVESDGTELVYMLKHLRAGFFSKARAARRRLVGPAPAAVLRAGEDQSIPTWVRKATLFNRRPR